MAKKAKYEVSIDLTSGQSYSSKGETVESALMGLDLSYQDVKTKGVITLKEGNKSASKMFYLRPLRRVVANKLRKAQVGRDLLFLLKEHA